MELIINDNGTAIPAKDWIKFDFRLAMSDTTLGNNYYFIALKISQDISQLLLKYDEKPELKIYFYKNILYITFDNEMYHYTIGLFEPEFNILKEQIKNDNKVLFGLFNNEDELEYYLVYNII